ncbi:MAG: 3-isopropylmalate dehydratase [Candidatus Omnitrophica bacterium CG03_land_8_20_14_0_80_43_22]|nr:MAG: 3-isopropylmalate dehydratase [Candidatus Omnitrophica bacterium CG03_land_8_20_14_0_80_43_22]
MIVRGKAVRLKQSDDINTDYIISGRYKFAISDPKELAKHVFEDIDLDFARNLKPGDILVAGKNFGMGSSREQAPVSLKAAGIKAIVAQSFARIFYRNSFNIGLALVECDTKDLTAGDELEIYFEKAVLSNKTKSKNIKITKLPQMLLDFLKYDGAVAYLKTKGK